MSQSLTVRDYKKLRLDSWMRHSHLGEKAGKVEKFLTLSILAVNILISFFVGCVIGWFALVHPITTPELKVFMIVGFMGGHAIASSFSLDMLPILHPRRFIPAGYFITLSVLSSLMAMMFGIYSMRVFAW